ncbi:phosphodiester glycosidase family protein [Acinetobacter gerneri]|uniref:phosphodiester glycosidase family protein n=1 Tax=Acinetobacter gerneri TaxID=202952 RepID=UPI002935437E|nr:phosphodiester glycosidase family protein [Acinetobacter gerneri]MDV2441650.1 phosphodiester glycosidase family protein [Acinetobacter gerneri]
MKMFKKLLFSMLISQQLIQLAHANTEYFHYKTPQNIDADVVKVSNLKDLKLFLNDANHKPYQNFGKIKQNLKKCQNMLFAMNAGMYHADYSPVGLYIEHSQTIKKLNTDTGFGNFFMQPNGVLAWNDNTAKIISTQKFAQTNFKAKYATQSGPMLVIDGKINPQFEAQSNSLKIRNGVGIKDNQLYFVISNNKVNFYQFAAFFKNALGIEQALYLDGSISSAFIPQAKRMDQRFGLGPMIAVIDSKQCK